MMVESIQNKWKFNLGMEVTFKFIQILLTDLFQQVIYIVFMEIKFSTYK